MKAGIRQTIGKRISGIIIAENDHNPLTQIFFVFDDDTYFEICVETFALTNSIDIGSLAELESNLSKVSANITHRLFTNGKSPPKPSSKLKKWLARRNNIGKHHTEAFNQGINISWNSDVYDPESLEEPLRTEAIEYLAFIEPKIFE